MFVFVFESGGEGVTKPYMGGRGSGKIFFWGCEISDLFYFGLLPCGWR